MWTHRLREDELHKREGVELNIHAASFINGLHCSEERFAYSAESSFKGVQRQSES